MITEIEIIGKIFSIGYTALKPNELEILKKSLFYKEFGFDDIKLSEIDIKIIKLFLDNSFSKNQTLDCIELSKEEIEDKLQLTKEEIKDFINKFDSNILQTISATGYQKYKLSYSIFWKTNYLQLTNYSLHFLELLFSFIDFLENEDLLKYDFHDEISIIKLQEKNIPFTDEQLNSILKYLLERELIKEIRTRTYNDKYILESFVLENEFKNFIRKLRINK